MVWVVVGSDRSGGQSDDRFWLVIVKMVVEVVVSEHLR